MHLGAAPDSDTAVSQDVGGSFSSLDPSEQVGITFTQFGGRKTSGEAVITSFCDLLFFLLNQERHTIRLSCSQI